MLAKSIKKILYLYFKIIYKNYSPFKAGEFLLFFNFKNTKKCIQIPYNIRRYKTKNMTQLHFVCVCGCFSFCTHHYSTGLWAQQPIGSVLLPWLLLAFLLS